MSTSLAPLVSPHDSAEFLTALAADLPLQLDDCAMRDVVYGAWPALRSLADLLHAWPHSVQVHLPDFADEASAVTATTRDACKMFSNGMGLLFNDVHVGNRELTELLVGLRQDLGLSALTDCRCLVYATPDGAGAAPHFDQNINIVVQLDGKKIWRLADNDNAERPLTRHLIGLPPDPELATYAHLPMPIAMPPECRTVMLKPGDVLLVPRGMWHATQAVGDALALNFTFSAPTWIDLLTAAMRSRLAKSYAWRETATAASAENFAALLAELGEDLPGWSAVEILSQTEAPHHESCHRGRV